MSAFVTTRLRTLWGLHLTQSKCQVLPGAFQTQSVLPLPLGASTSLALAPSTLAILASWLFLTQASLYLRAFALPLAISCKALATDFCRVVSFASFRSLLKCFLSQRTLPTIQCTIPPRAPAWFFPASCVVLRHAVYCT